MNIEHLQAVAKGLGLKMDREREFAVPDGSSMTLYLAHDGASMSVPKVESMRVDGEMVYARTTKKEMFALAVVDVYAVAVDGSPGQPLRRAGFGA